MFWEECTWRGTAEAISEGVGIESGMRADDSARDDGRWLEVVIGPG